METTPSRPDPHPHSSTPPHGNRVRNIGIAFTAIVLVLGLAAYLFVPSKTPTGVLDPAQAHLERVLDANPSLVQQFCSTRATMLKQGLSDSDIIQVDSNQGDFAAFSGLTDEDVYYAIANRCAG